MDRTTSPVFYKFDHVLGELGQRNNRLIIDCMVGILMIMNA